MPKLFDSDIKVIAPLHFCLNLKVACFKFLIYTLLELLLLSRFSPLNPSDHWATAFAFGFWVVLFFCGVCGVFCGAGIKEMTSAVFALEWYLRSIWRACWVSLLRSFSFSLRLYMKWIHWYEKRGGSPR